MCYYILTPNGQVISRSTVQHIPKDELLADDITTQVEAVDKEISGRLNDLNQEENMFYIEDIGDADDDDLVPIELTNIPKADNVSPDSFNEYIGAQLMLTKGDGQIQGTMTKRIKSKGGVPIGHRNLNPMLDTRRYEVELSDRTTIEYFANVFDLDSCANMPVVL